MHQHPTVSNKVGVEVLHLKIVDCNRRLQHPAGNRFNCCFGSVCQPDSLPRMQRGRLYPAFSLDIIRMRGCAGDLLAVDGNCRRFLCLIDKGSGYRSIGILSRLRIGAKHFIAAFNFFDSLFSSLGSNKCSYDKTGYGIGRISHQSRI